MATQEPLLMIPGPTEFHPDVLKAMATKGTSHVDPKFIKCFSEVIKQTRNVFLSRDGQPFILSGSGTLGWDLTAANFVVPGDLALVVNTGYFGDRFGDCLETYGVKVKQIRVSTPGDRPSATQIAEMLRQNKDAKLLTITHVDTSTGVRMNLQEVIAAARSVSPDILVAVDGVCALGGEEMRMSDWDIDIYLTGSQKALGVPPGLSVSVISQRAMRKFEELLSKNQKPRSYYANVQRWLPIMKAYENETPAYFATPAVNLVFALHVANEILLRDGGMEKRFEEHKQAASTFRSALRKLGFQFVPVKEEYAAYTMSAVKYPNFKSDCDAAAFRGVCKREGIICAGGLHAAIKNEYFRVGHMGLSTRQQSHIKTAVTAIQIAREKCSLQARL